MLKKICVASSGLSVVMLVALAISYPKQIPAAFGVFAGDVRGVAQGTVEGFLPGFKKRVELFEIDQVIKQGEWKQELFLRNQDDEKQRLNVIEGNLFETDRRIEKLEGKLDEIEGAAAKLRGRLARGDGGVIEIGCKQVPRQIVERDLEKLVEIANAARREYEKLVQIRNVQNDHKKILEDRSENGDLRFVEVEYDIAKLKKLRDEKQAGFGNDPRVISVLEGIAGEKTKPDNRVDELVTVALLDAEGKEKN